MKIIIEVHPTEGLKISAPLDHPLVCIGMLEAAKLKVVETMEKGPPKPQGPQIVTEHGVSASAVRQPGA